jgi:hypothetical protein
MFEHWVDKLSKLDKNTRNKTGFNRMSPLTRIRLIADVSCIRISPYDTALVHIRTNPALAVSRANMSHSN